MIALAECCLACRAFFSPSWLRCGAGLLLVLRGARSLVRELSRKLCSRCAFDLRGLTGRDNDDTEKRRNTTASFIKRSQQFDVVHVSRRSGCRPRQRLPVFKPRVFCEICKVQRKLLIAQYGPICGFLCG